MLTRLWDLLSSWRLSIVLTLSGALYVGFLAVWAARSPAHVVATISGMLPYSLFYLFLLVNLLACLVRRLPALLAGMRSRPRFVPHTFDREEILDDTSLPAGKWQEGEGYRYLIVHRFSNLGTLLLHGAIFVLALGFYLSALSHREGVFMAGQGEKLEVTSKSYERSTPPRPLAASLPEMELQVESVDPVFWENRLLFTRFEVRVILDGKRRDLAINRPAVLSPYLTVRLTSFGYAPHLMVLMEGVDRPVEEVVLKRSLFPPGTWVHYESTHFPHRIEMALFPDYVDREGKPDTRSMELKNPRLLVEVYRGKVFLARRLLRLGEPLQVEEMTFACVQILPMVQITVVRDVGFPFILLAFLCALIGLFLRLPGRRIEMAIVEVDEGFRLRVKRYGGGDA